MECVEFGKQKSWWRKKKFHPCITEIKNKLSGPSSRYSFWFQLRIYMRQNCNIRAFFLFKGREFSYVVGTIKLNILWKQNGKTDYGIY